MVGWYTNILYVLVPLRSPANRQENFPATTYQQTVETPVGLSGVWPF